MLILFLVFTYRKHINLRFGNWFPCIWQTSGFDKSLYISFKIIEKRTRNQSLIECVLCVRTLQVLLLSEFHWLICWQNKLCFCWRLSVEDVIGKILQVVHLFLKRMNELKIF